jgi:two-component system chemotaxis response regulator CheY
MSTDMSDGKAKFLLTIIGQFLHNKSVLLIDDEDEIKSLMSNYLVMSHIAENKIVLASDGREAFNKMQNQEFGLIIVDILMPRMGGLQLIKELKLRAKFKDIPIVIISGTLEVENVKIAMSLGVNNIIVKPFNYNLFIEKIGLALSV